MIFFSILILFSVFLLIVLNFRDESKKEIQQPTKEPIIAILADINFDKFLFWGLVREKTGVSRSL